MWPTSIHGAKLCYIWVYVSQGDLFIEGSWTLKFEKSVILITKNNKTMDTKILTCALNNITIFGDRNLKNNGRKSVNNSVYLPYTWVPNIFHSE